MDPHQFLPCAAISGVFGGATCFILGPLFFLGWDPVFRLGFVFGGLALQPRTCDELT